jgi:hypothetical protein
LFAEGVKPVEIIHRMQAQYDAVKYMSGRIISKREELLYIMRRDQEGCHHQGLITIFKPLKEWYRKRDKSQWITLWRLLYIWPNERSSRRKIFS